MQIKKQATAALVGAILFSAAGLQGVQASSHREAPFITQMPKVDATDFYMFRSYEPGRENFVTIIANYYPLQDAFAGPNYFAMDPDALYEIHIDNDGDAVEDITFQFRFQIGYTNLQLDIGGESVAIPVINSRDTNAPINTARQNLHRNETYTVDVVRNGRRSNNSDPIIDGNTGGSTFTKPEDNIGDRTFGGIGAYENYANQFIKPISIPGCSAGNGKIFVGQRRDPFPVNLGEIFDLINTNPIGPRNGNETNALANKNITTLALEIPIACLTNGSDPIIGGWTTASKRQARVLNPSPNQTRGASVEGGAWSQVSRLGSPLVNEVVIGLTDKDRFNASEPVDDDQFATYVTNPTLPQLIENIFSGQFGDAVQAPQFFPRTDLVAVFLSGVTLPDDTRLTSRSGTSTPAEMLRLNTSIPVRARGTQHPLAVIGADILDANDNVIISGSDIAGFPNGRRPGDDVVDIAVRVAMGALLPLFSIDAPASAVFPYTDGVELRDTAFTNGFPYLNTPVSGSTPVEPAQ